MTKTIYVLKIAERDDYMRNHDFLFCKKVEINPEDKRVVENVVRIDGVETSCHSKTEYMIDGKYREFSFSDEYFETLESLKKHLETNYLLARASKHDFLFLDADDAYNSVVAITNYEDSMYVPGDGIVNLQELLGVRYGGEDGKV